MKRVLLLLLAAGIVWYLVKHSASSTLKPGVDGAASPIERARSAAGASDARTAAGDAVSAVSENMTPDQVRALLGSPDDVQTETLENGSTRETWTYRNVGKTVIFENGVAVSVR